MLSSDIAYNILYIQIDIYTLYNVKKKIEFVPHIKKYDSFFTFLCNLIINRFLYKKIFMLKQELMVQNGFARFPDCLKQINDLLEFI